MAPPAGDVHQASTAAPTGSLTLLPAHSTGSKKQSALSALNGTNKFVQSSSKLFLGALTFPICAYICTESWIFFECAKCIYIEAHVKMQCAVQHGPKIDNRTPYWRHSGVIALACSLILISTSSLTCSSLQQRVRFMCDEMSSLPESRCVVGFTASKYS